MSPRRAAHLGVAVVASFVVRVLVRFKPQRWCPPAITLRLFRMSSEAGNALNTADLERHVPPTGWTVRTDLAYAPGRFGGFDLALPQRSGPHPLVIWVHGGGWHFGDKRDLLPYAKLLAARGFAVAVVNYPLAPRARYPDAVNAVAEALAHLVREAPAYGLDPSRVVLAGDSVGTQLVGEVVASGTTDLAGLVLFCGVYEPAALDDSDRMFEAVLESAMWSLTRSRAWKSSPVTGRMSVLERATADFPPTFISGGRQDPLFRRQTPPMAQRLRELGVPVEEFLAGDDAEPCFHQFQLRLGTAPGAEAFERLVAFLERNLGRRAQPEHNSH
ncbi:MAG: alpha/beta hydrolase [Marmoricola sp.]